ncbi:MAG: N-6 DNA methylase [Candidatus Calescibacterium sp.]|nr:N-6 DNA methylase [Candidatus Calescibacterium sp.]
MQILSDYRSDQEKRHFSKSEKVLGQFFTSPEVAEFVVSLAQKYVSKKGTACDPACGDGVFLKALLNHGFTPLGIDIDKNILNFLPDDLKKYVKIEDGLALNDNYKFDLVLGNPPFSSKYGRVKGNILKNFELAQKLQSQAIEILFLEKFIKLCSEGGVIGIILPHGIFSNTRLNYVRNYMKKHLSIITIVSLPRNIFRSKGTQTASKTCILIGKKDPKPSNEKIMFASIDSVSELMGKDIKRKIFAVPSEFLYPEFYLEKNTILDRFPKLKDFNIEVIQGRTKYGNKRKFSATGIPYISAKNVTMLGIDFSKDKRFIEPGSIMDNEKSHVCVGDVVFVRVGVGCIGKVAVVSNENEKGVADSWIYIIRLKDTRLSPFYLALWLQTSAVQREIRRLARGVGTVTIPISLFKELPVPLPSYELLKECEEIYHEIVSNRINNQIKEAYNIRNKICRKLENIFLGKETKL